MSNPRRWLLVPAAAALLLAACGSDSDSSAGTTLDTAAETTVATTATPTTVAPSTTTATTATAATTTATTPGTEQPATGNVVEIIIDVDDPAQVGQTWPVGLGQTVVLRLLSDTDQEYHVHGFDLETQAAAGVEATMEFTADQAGDFEVESHTTDAVLAILQVS